MPTTSSTGWLTACSARARRSTTRCVLGGAQGIGKDTMLEPVKHAVGPWNFHEMSPANMLGRVQRLTSSR